MEHPDVPGLACLVECSDASKTNSVGPSFSCRSRHALAIGHFARSGQTGLPVTVDKEDGLFVLSRTRRPTKAVEIVLNSLRQAGLSPSALAASIPDSLLLEIGCGRDIGFAPFTLGLGAKGYLGVDPALDADVLKDADVKRCYLSPALTAAKNLVDGLTEFRELPFLLAGNPVDELMSRCRLTRGA